MAMVSIISLDQYMMLITNLKLMVELRVTVTSGEDHGEDYGDGKYNISRSVHDVDNQLEADGRNHFNISRS